MAVGYTLSNGYLMMADYGKIGGELDIFCCSTDITIEQSAESFDIACDRTLGREDRTDYNPSGTVTVRELNFNSTVLERALNLTTTYNTDGFEVMGNGSNPATTPTAISQVDGPIAPSYDGSGNAVMTLHNTLITSGSVYAWSRAADGTFSLIAAWTPNYAHANTNLATGEVYGQIAAKTSPVYFTYKYQSTLPYTGARVMSNAWGLGSTNFKWLRIVHEHQDGTHLYFIDVWKAKAQPNVSLNIKSSSGDPLVPVEIVYDMFADRRYHPTSPLYRITRVVKATYELTTPLYGCDGETWATPLAQ